MVHLQFICKPSPSGKKAFDIGLSGGSDPGSRAPRRK
jgi:hypothetical protein